jgi:hypothetical protein
MFCIAGIDGDDRFFGKGSRVALMMGLRVLVSGLLGAVLLCGPAPLWADEAGLAPPKPTSPEVGTAISLPSTTGPIVTDLAITQAYQTWTAQITPAMTFTGGAFNRDWQRRSVGANLPTQKEQIDAAGNYKSLQVPVEIYYGLTPRMDVSVTIPFIQNWASEVGPPSQAANFGSLGDSSLQLRYRLLTGTPTATTVTGYFSVLFPSGHASRLEPKLVGIDQTGLGALAFTWGIDVFKYLPDVPILLYANIWYTNYADGNAGGARVYYPDQVKVNLAMEIPFRNSPSNRWAFLLEVLSNWDAGRMFGPRANQASSAIISALPALEFLPTSWLHLAAGVQVSLWGKNSLYGYTPTLALFLNF